MAAQDYTVFLKDSVKFSMKAVASETKEDVVLYERSTYRNTFDASEVNAASVAGYTAPFTFPSAGGFSTIVEHDDRFLATAPHHEAKTRSRYVWKNAGSDVLGWAWCDRIVNIATGDTTRL